MRQWVLSFPFQLRFLFASRPEIMGGCRATAVQRYIDFVADGVGLPSIWLGLTHPHYPGGQGFIDRLDEQYAAENRTDLKEVPRMQRRSLSRPLDYYPTHYPDPKTGMVAVYASGDC